MIRRPPRSTRTDTLFPYTTLFRSLPSALRSELLADLGQMHLAMDNCPNQLVLFGPHEEAAKLHERLRGEGANRSDEHRSELQSQMRSSYDVFCLKNTNELPAILMTHATS